MADRRPAPDDADMPKGKRPKTTDLDPTANPYLAHHYESNGGYQSNGYNGNSGSTALSNFKRHATTALQAHDVEDGPNNPFNGNPLSQQYFKILKTRRDLPVHKQR